MAAIATIHELCLDKNEIESKIGHVGLKDVKKKVIERKRRR